MDSISEIQKKMYADLHNSNKGDLTSAVGSETLAHKRERYRLILDLISPGTRSIHDAGGGVGALYEFLLEEHHDRLKTLEYSLSDLYPEFVKIFRDKYQKEGFVCDLAAGPLPALHDALVLSGVFHRSSGLGYESDLRYFQKVIRNAWSSCSKQLVFNIPSPIVETPREINFHIEWKDLIEQVVGLSRFFTVSQPSALFETTVSIYKPALVREDNQFSELDRYLS